MKQDLLNIVVRCNMRPGWRDNDDVVSVRLRYEENNPDDGIKVFELPQDTSGKGFVIVIVTPIMLEWIKKYSSKGITLDDTFHTTRYNLRLATLMVVDERDRGLPGAFLMSGTMTSSDVEKLFTVIRALVPEFEPEKMVTDEAPCFYKGFRAVFPRARTRIHFCRFHILQSWKRKINQVVEVSLRASVCSSLKRLLGEPRLEAFIQRFGEILGYLRLKGQGVTVDYLEKNYLARTPTWASFANEGAVLDTTMISERFHRRIKEEFLHRNGNSRLDGFVELSIRAVKELAEDVEIKERRRFVGCAFRLTETHKRHRTALEMFKWNSDLVLKADPNKWEVYSKCRTKHFVVSWKGECNCNPQKNTHCQKCNVCAYSYTCTCPDNRPGISCAHRYAVMMECRTVRGTEPEEVASEPIKELDWETSTMQDAEMPIVDDTETSINEAHGRLEIRYQKLHSIKRMTAIIEARAVSMAKVDSSEAETILEDAVNQLQVVAKTLGGSQTEQLIPRPEMARVGAKPHISCVPLYQRVKVRKEKKCRRQ